MPADLDVTWFANRDEAQTAIVDADIAWVDMPGPEDTAATIACATRLRWLSTIYAGVDSFDLDQLRRMGTVLTNGTGINANAVAEYAVMGMLVAAKRFDQVYAARQRHEWPSDSPGKVELAGSKALIIGYGTIGRLIGDRLRAFDVDVTGVTRSGRENTLTPVQWRHRIDVFDWIVLAAPATNETGTMIGAAELSAMKPGAWLVNFARGSMVDQDALVSALSARRIGGAFLDTVTPEPLPADHPLWTAPNAILSMHLSGRSQTTMFTRAARLFLDNLAAFRAGRALVNQVDLALGY